MLRKDVSVEGGRQVGDVGPGVLLGAAHPLRAVRTRRHGVCMRGRKAALSQVLIVGSIAFIISININ